MTDLSKVSTKALRRELDRREEEKRAKDWEAIRAAHPCPECGGDPVKIETNAIEEHRLAPRDDEGRVLLWMPYESDQGMTAGMTYERKVTCENGHETVSFETRWYEEPRKGMPVLPWS